MTFSVLIFFLAKEFLLKLKSKVDFSVLIKHQSIYTVEVES